MHRGGVRKTKTEAGKQATAGYGYSTTGRRSATGGKVASDAVVASGTRADNGTQHHKWKVALDKLKEITEVMPSVTMYEYALLSGDRKSVHMIRITKGSRVSKSSTTAMKASLLAVPCVGGPDGGSGSGENQWKDTMMDCTWKDEEMEEMVHIMHGTRNCVGLQTRVECTW
jgi:hypothetical protein